MEQDVRGSVLAFAYRGFTIIELLITIVIIGVLLTLATPSVRSMMDKQRVRGTCESIYQNLALARSSTASLNKNITFNFRNPGTNWCVGLTDSAVTPTTCDCNSAPNNCTVNGMKRTASYTDFSGSSITVNGIADNTSVIFNARDATPSPVPGTISVSSSFWACAIKVETLGQVRYLKQGTGKYAVSIVPVAEAGSLTN